MGPRSRPTPEIVRRLVIAGFVRLSTKTVALIARVNLSVADLSHSVVHGTVRKREKDETGMARYKYTIVGPALEGRKIYSCGKVVSDEGGNTYFFITAHDLNA